MGKKINLASGFENALTEFALRWWPGQQKTIFFMVERILIQNYLGEFQFITNFTRNLI